MPEVPTITEERVCSITTKTGSVVLSRVNNTYHVTRLDTRGHIIDGARYDTLVGAMLRFDFWSARIEYEAARMVDRNRMLALEDQWEPDAELTD